MADYSKTTWVTGDLITATLINKLETQYDVSKAELQAGNFNVPASCIGAGSFSVDRMPNATKTIFLSAAGGVPSLTAGCGGHLQQETSGNKINYVTLDFDHITNEYAQWLFLMPDGITNGQFYATFIWTADAGTGNVRWGIQAKFMGDGILLDTNWGVAQEVNDTKLANYGVHISPLSALVVPGGAAAGGTMMAIRVYRKASDTGNDTIANDVKLLGVKLEYTATYQD